jgi:hypothetical protein
MSEPANDAAAPAPEPAPPEAPSRRRDGKALLIAALAIVFVIGAVATSPFWAPPVMHALPWNTSEPKPQTDPALASIKTEAAHISTAVQQLGQRVAMLEGKTPPDLAPLQQRVAALEAKPAPDLGPVQQQLAALDRTTADLAQKLAALDKAEQAQSVGDPRNTALALALLQIRDAVEIGRPFESEYQALLALSRERPEIAAAAAPLGGPAQTGVATRAALIERLRQLAPQITTATSPPSDDWHSRLTARLRALVTIRRIEGNDRDPGAATVATAQRLLAGGDLGGAIDALSRLDEPSKSAAQPWLKTASQRVTVETALHQVQTALIAVLGKPGAAAGKSG